MFLIDREELSHRRSITETAYSTNTERKKGNILGKLTTKGSRGKRILEIVPSRAKANRNLNEKGTTHQKNFWEEAASRG